MRPYPTMAVALAACESGPTGQRDPVYHGAGHCDYVRHLQSLPPVAGLAGGGGR